MADKFKFTSVAIEKLKLPKTGRVEYADSMLPGFTLRVTDKGAKSWSLMYRHGGKLRRMTLGRYPVVDLSDARDRARDALKLVEKGIDPSSERQAIVAAEMDIETVCKDFIERYAKPKNRTWKGTERILDMHVLPEWRGRKITSIKRADVAALLDSVADKGGRYEDRQSQLPRHVFAAIRRMFNWAAERGIIEISPCNHVRAPGKSLSRDRVLNDSEIKRVWDAATTMGYPFGSVVQMLLSTAQRKDEVACMTWDEVDLKRKLWIVPRERVKADRTHEVPLSDEVATLLASLPRFDKGPFVFSTTFGKRPCSGFSKAKARLDRLSAVEEWRLHDLRRTAGTNLARLGVPVSVISRVLNHAQGGVTAIYDRHSYFDQKKEALEKWSSSLTKLTNPIDLSSSEASIPTPSHVSPKNNAKSMT